MLYYLPSPLFSPQRGSTRGQDYPVHVVWLHEYHYLCASLNIDIKHIQAIIYIGSCAELKKAQKQYEREETEVCACMYLYMNVYDSVNCRQPVLVKILVQVQELPLPRYIYKYKLNKSFLIILAEWSIHEQT